MIVDYVRENVNETRIDLLRPVRNLIRLIFLTSLTLNITALPEDSLIFAMKRFLSIVHFTFFPNLKIES